MFRASIVLVFGKANCHKDMNTRSQWNLALKMFSDGDKRSHQKRNGRISDSNKLLRYATVRGESKVIACSAERGGGGGSKGGIDSPW